MPKEISLRNAAELCAQQFTVEYPSGSEKIFIRTRTRAEIESAERESADMILAIKEKYRSGTTAYQIATRDLDMRTDSELALFGVSPEYPEIGRKVQRELPTLIPFDPAFYHSDSDREKAREESEKQRAEHMERWEQRVYELATEREQELLKLPREQLVEIAVRPYIESRINVEVAELMEAFAIRDCVREGEDHSNRYFETMEDVPAPGSVRNYLIAAIGQIELVDGFDIKNSQGRSVMQIGPAESTQDASQDRSTQDSQASTSPKPRPRGGSR